jgi:hypothetical protein
MVEEQAIERRSLQSNVPAVSPTVPVNCGSPVKIDIKSTTEYRVYLEGAQVGYSNGVQIQSFTGTVNTRCEALPACPPGPVSTPSDHLSSRSQPFAIAIEATRDINMPNFADADGLSVVVSVCGKQVTSDFTWACTDTRPWTNNWRLSAYSPNGWMQVRTNHQAHRHSNSECCLSFEPYPCQWVSGPDLFSASARERGLGGSLQVRLLVGYKSAAQILFSCTKECAGPWKATTNPGLFLRRPCPSTGGPAARGWLDQRRLGVLGVVQDLQ